MSHFRSFEMVVPKNLNDSTAVTVLFMMVSGGSAGGFLLKSTIISTCFKRVKLQVVKTAPDSQLLNLLSVSRLITVLNEADKCGVVCKLQELDRGVFRCAGRWCRERRAVGREHSPEELQCWWCGCWMCIFSASLVLPVCQEAVDPLTDGGGDGELS